ncbi:LolA-related protein [Montanilutibacter psychrotolerans]|uniref:Fatty acyl CoA synthetase n=1 Tax=Montanilutibacter psychrotolerans TaxID=1327343 RepID=A0A3M8SR78_9GAMM|nr:LolA-related protein [Lysobacter psychrotolerans]RNF83838.1 fatty acyl CoA synthetase [Lysobacter psychrotolerans]
MALVASPLAAAPPEVQAASVDWALAQLAQPTPSRTEFLELRGSAMLKQPLRLQGEYRRPDGATLVREVRQPYAETTTIRAGEVRIARAGQSPRTFSLARAPELAGLQASFGALLSGDRARLERDYRIVVNGSRAQWTLALRPNDAALAARVQAIVLYGRAAELRCIETRAVPARGGPMAAPQRTLLAGAARAAATVAEPAGLAALCTGQPAQ